MVAVTKYLLDTNVWSYVADANMMPALLRACCRKRIQFMIAPASVTEARNLSNAPIRKSILSVMTHERWTRLMPETFLEAQEIKAALLSLRPQWANMERNFKDFNRNRHYWLRREGGFWQFSRDEVDFPETNESQREMIENDLARKEVRYIRDQFKDGDQRDSLTHLLKTTIQLSNPKAGMNTVEYWRVASSYHVLEELKVYASPYREWLDCEIDVNVMTSNMEDFEQLWFRELQPDQVKRQWLRTSMEYLQRWHRPTDGSPVDSQLASHLVDADYFVTADKNFAKCVEKIHGEAPFLTAKPLKISAGIDGIHELIAFSTGKA